MAASGIVPIVHPVINWSDWTPLFPTKELDVIPQEPGIYLVSHESLSGIQYVGHSRTDLRDRIRRMGYAIDSEEMPYRDPHTAAPCLWAIAQEYDMDYQVCWASIGRIGGDETPASLTSTRTIGELATVNELVGLKAAYIAGYRFVSRQSPTANFGYMLPGYEQSGPSSSGKRGGKIEQDDVEPGVREETIATWDAWDDLTSDSWMGFDWETYDLGDFEDPYPEAEGVFRIWQKGTDTLAQVGVTTDIRNQVLDAEMHENGTMVSFDQRDIGDVADRQAIATDLVGAHYLAKDIVPKSSVTKEDLPNDEIRDLIDEYESQTVESKAELSDPQKIRKAVVALANAEGGYLLVGVEDSGTVAGIETTSSGKDPQRVEERLLNIIEDGVDPNSPLRFTQIAEIDSNQVLIAEIEKADEIPYSENGRFYQRRGSESRKLNGVDLRQFVEERHSDLPSE
ncbi:helix-turn-helix domain-containing protein [Halorientalis halophila]|uniref:AlbA family DNA-binding domain-containing protein n=1 Tax=Halorientalis halophila TaxID=3108499 RepID=UPI00300BF48F